MELSTIANVIKKVAIPIKDRHSANAAATNYTHLLEAIGDAEVVMVGDASHGTQDFYEQRSEITKLLVENKGFTFIAVEADWPDAYRVNRFIQNGRKADANAKDSLGDFRRFPMWMWRNHPVLDFIEWLRSWNDKMAQVDKTKKVAFYGMDLFSFYSSMNSVIEYLNQVSPEDAKLAKKRYANFDRFQGEPSSYGFAAGFGLSKSFEKDVVSTLVDLQKKEETYLKGAGGLIDGDELFYTQQNAKLVAHAEEYYRKMYHADEVTWNIRDRHMADCVQSLFEFHQRKMQGKRKEKVILWAHNSHLGDASFTEAGKRDEVNVGQLMREKFGLQKTFNIGFSTFQGSVTATKQWDEPAQCDRVRNGLWGSYEHIMQAASQDMGINDYYLLFRSNSPQISPDADVVRALSQPARLERYIGCIYRPDTEKASHYCKSLLPKEFDSVVFLSSTKAIEPLDKTVPWLESYSLIAAMPDVDPYPELEVGTVMQGESFDWRMRAAEEINEIGIQMMDRKAYELAVAKFDKAVKYIEHEMSKYQTKRALHEVRCKVLINRAEANTHLKHWAPVVRDCASVLSLKPTHIQAHLLAARAYEARGNDHEAKHHYEMAAKQSAEKPFHVTVEERK